MDISEAREICTCPGCPTYVDCTESVAFCLYETGHSACITTENGCICPGCPVYAIEHMDHVLYCTRGSEAQRTADEPVHEKE